MIKHVLLLSLLLVIIRSSSCHYSCSNCTGRFYTSCLKCKDGRNVNVVENPQVIPKQFWSSLYASGTCIDTLSEKANGLGIILFLFLTIACLIIRTKQSFYLYLTIQTFGLYNLIQIGWVNPIGFLLESMQYLMIWNVVGSGYKREDYILTASKNYRIKKFLNQTQIGQNLALIAIFTIVSFVLLIVICLISIRRKKQKEQLKKDQVLYENILNQSDMDRGQPIKQPTTECCACWKFFSEEVLIQIAKLLIVILYFMIQQTMLVLLVTLVFQKPAGASIILLCIVYLHILVFIMSYGYYYRIEYFKEKKTMYLNFAKKIILPVMVVIPIQNQYLIFIFAIAIFIVEFIIDYSNDLYQKFNRLVFYKILEIMIIILLAIYYIVEVNTKSYSASRAAAIACTMLISFYLIVFVIVELPLGIKEKYFDNKSGNDEVGNVQIGNNEITLQEIHEKDGNVLEERERKMINVNMMNTIELVSISNEDQEDEEEYEDEQEENDNQNENENDKDKNENDRDKIDNDRDNNNNENEQNSILFGQTADKKQSREDKATKDENNSKATKNLNEDENNSKATKNLNEDENNSMATKNLNEDENQLKPEQPKPRKKRKQIIDKELRLRYGI